MHDKGKRKKCTSLLEMALWDVRQLELENKPRQKFIFFFGLWPTFETPLLELISPTPSVFVVHKTESESQNWVRKGCWRLRKELVRHTFYTALEKVKFVSFWRMHHCNGNASSMQHWGLLSPMLNVGLVGTGTWKKLQHMRPGHRGRYGSYERCETDWRLGTRDATYSSAVTQRGHLLFLEYNNYS